MKYQCSVCKRFRAEDIEPLSDTSTTHGLCARCFAADPQSRYLPIDKVKSDQEAINEHKDQIRREIQENIHWVPPGNPDWKDKEFSKEDFEFYEELRREVESEMNIGLKR